MSKRSLLAIFLLALAPRLAYLLLSQPPYTGEYWDLSTSLLSSGALAPRGVPITRFEPLYPLFLWMARAITGDLAFAVQVLQVAVASTGAVWIFLLTEGLTAQRRLAWTAAITFAAYPLLIRHASAPSESALTTALLPLFAWLFVRTRSGGHAALAGVALGLAILNRTVALPVLPLAGGLLVFRNERRQAAALVAACILVVAPMLARNAVVGGVLLPSRHGVTLFMGNTPYAAAIMPEHSPDLLQAHAYRVAVEKAPHLDPLAPTFDDDVDAILAAVAYEDMLAQPLRTLVLKLRFVAYFFSPTLVPSRLLLPETTIAFDPDGRVHVAGAPLRPPIERVVHAVSTVALVAAAAFGVAHRRRSLARDAILWSILLTFVLVHAVYFPATRYTAPVLFVLMFYAAVGLEAGVGQVSRAGSRRQGS